MHATEAVCLAGVGAWYAMQLMLTVRLARLVLSVGQFEPKLVCASDMSESHLGQTA